MRGDGSAGADRMNVVAFRISGLDEVAVTDVPDDVDDGVAQAWRKVFRQRRVPAEKVVEIHMEWAASAGDHEFMGRNFPNLGDVSFNFERPAADGWAAAREHAAAIREVAMQELVEEEQAAAPNGVAAGDDPAMPPLIPLLRMVTSEPPLSASRTLIPNQLYVLAAWVSPTPRGTLGMNWVLKNFVEQEQINFDDVLAAAYADLWENVTVGAYDAKDGTDRMLQLEGNSLTFMPAAVVASPQFREKMAEYLGGDRFLAGISCHDHLHVVRADSAYAEGLQEMVFGSDHVEEDLVPTMLLIEPDGMQIVSQKGTPLD